MADLSEFAPEGCTHNCTTCGAGCGDADSDGSVMTGKMEQMLDKFASIDTEDFLKALQEIVEDD